MSEPEKFYGIWDGARWLSEGGNLIYGQSKGVLNARLAEMKRSDGRYVGNKDLKVAVIPDDGGKPEE